MASNDRNAPVTRFCLLLEQDRRTPDGRVRSVTEFRRHFFPYDTSSSNDRILKLLPREVRGPILAAWGIRGKKTAMRDDDERVANALHDAFLAGDIDDAIFEEGIGVDVLIEWGDLRDYWTFWRGGRQNTHSIERALSGAYDLGLFDARWFLDVIESTDGSRRGTDVVADGMSEADLGQWIKTIHRTGDGSPKGLLEAVGFSALAAKTPAPVLLSVIDAFAEKSGLLRARAGAGAGSEMFDPMDELIVVDASTSP